MCADVDAARRNFAGSEPASDLLLMVRAYKGWEDALEKGRSAARNYCAKYCLSEATLQQLRDMRNQFTDLLGTRACSPNMAVFHP